MQGRSGLRQVLKYVDEADEDEDDDDDDDGDDEETE